MDGLPFSQAAENNREPILGGLRECLASCRSVVEIGAGTGQHAVHFAEQLPWLTWHPTEHADALGLLRPRCAAARLANLAAPTALDIAAGPWPDPWPDAVYTANTLHIVAPVLVEALFAAVSRAPAGALLVVYGPFNYGGGYTAESNARFDDWLKARDPASGIRDVEWVHDLAGAAGYALVEDRPMPANNRLLWWRRGA